MPKPFKNAPSEYALHELCLLATTSPTMHNRNGYDVWVPARPQGYFSFRARLRKAWKVFTGHADIVVWPGDQ